MNIRLLSKEELAGYAGSGGSPIPCATAAGIIENLRSLCIKDDFEGFQNAMGSEKFEIIDLHDVMIEAIQQDRVEFVSLLLSHGFPITPYYARKQQFTRQRVSLDAS